MFISAVAQIGTCRESMKIIGDIGGGPGMTVEETTDVQQVYYSILSYKVILQYYQNTAIFI